MTTSSTKIAKPSFIQVLHNQTCYPYSQESFATFLEHAKSPENLEFWLAVRHYKFYCFTFFSNKVRTVDDGNNSEFNIALEDMDDAVVLSDRALFRFTAAEAASLPLSEATHFSILKEKLYMLLKTFILPGSEKEINIPQKVRTALLRQVTVQDIFHPAVLRPARDLIFNLMRESSYTAWLKEVAASTHPRPSESLLDQRSSQSGDSGISGRNSPCRPSTDCRGDGNGNGHGNYDDEDDDRRALTKHTIRIKRSLSPLARGIKDGLKDLTLQHRHRRYGSAPTVGMGDVQFMRFVTYT